jgi:hypothetical protein
MRGVVLRSLAVILVGGVVLAGVLFLASTVDARPPQVISISVTQPVGDDAQLALVNTSIEVAFSEPVEPDSAAAALRIDPEVDGTTSWSGSTLIFTPEHPLELDTEYVVTIEPTVRDPNGNEMMEAPPPFAFATSGRPAVVESDPADGSEAVPLDAVVRLAFSTLMDTASVEAALRIEPAVASELRWNGEVLEIVPDEPLAANTEYTVAIGADAADVAGVALEDETRITFRTVAPGLAVASMVPADEVDGIALRTTIAVVFDRPIDPATLDPDLLVVEPEVAGTLEVVPLPGEEGDGDDESDEPGRVLRFTPSGPLPPNTTFSVELLPGLEATSGGGLAAPVSWTFTTGPPPSPISNQITFITDRAGIPNVWAMNPDGTGQRQLSAEVSPVVDYAVAPDGSSLVVSDGRQLIFLLSDSGERRVLTEEGSWEFDPAYAPDGLTLAFGRADAETGTGMGLWLWEVGGGAATRIELPADLRAPDAPSPDPDAAILLRAPRFSPDGQALAFVDVAGGVGVLELPTERTTRVPFRATAAPLWLPDSSAILVTGSSDEEPAGPTIEAPVHPLKAADDDEVFRLGRSATEIDETVFAPGWRVLAVAAGGTIAFTDGDQRLGLTDSLTTVPPDRLLGGAPVIDAAFAPGNESLALAVRDGADTTHIERLEVGSDTREPLTESGERPRWLP